MLLLARKCNGEIARGTKKHKESCQVNWDCMPSLTCVPQTTEGNCTPIHDNKNRCLCLMPSRFAMACNDKEDCENDLRCIRGFCSDPGKNGTVCAPHLDDGDCDTGFTCINESCLPKSDINKTCNVFWNCIDGLGLACINNTCQKLSKPGGPCDSSIDCDNSICALGTDGKRRCDSDISSIMGSLVAFCVVMITIGTLQFYAWRPRRR